jgi:hypothetical protein
MSVVNQASLPFINLFIKSSAKDSKKPRLTTKSIKKTIYANIIGFSKE